MMHTVVDIIDINEHIDGTFEDLAGALLCSMSRVMWCLYGCV